MDLAPDELFQSGLTEVELAVNLALVFDIRARAACGSHGILSFENLE
jgi:hypothetical protein